MLLHDLQAAFAAAVSGNDNGSLASHILSGGVDQEQRLAVYRNNMRHNFREALRAVYPVVERLVGERFFNHAADRYMAIYPSLSGDIHRFGGSFPEFLSGFPAAAQLAYLPDTARLEWAMHEVFHASDHAPLALDELGQLPQASYADLRFTLHPACRLLSSPFPVHRIWELNQPSREWEGTVDIGGEGALLLIRRRGFEVEVMSLEAAEFAMLRALSEGYAVGAAYESALRADEGFELARFILRHVVQQTIVGFHAEAPQAELENAALRERQWN
jgi:hypothetical protein